MNKNRIILVLLMLAVVLIGLPLLGVALAGHAISTYLELPPLTRYVPHAQFNLGVFIGLGVFTLTVLWPFFRNLCRTWHPITHQPQDKSAAADTPNCAVLLTEQDQPAPIFQHLFGTTEKMAANAIFPRWGRAALVVMAMAWLLAWTRFGWFASFQRYTFIPLWLAAIGVMNALTWRRLGSCLMTRRPAFFLVLFPISALFWWFFEYLNRFCQNWYYQGAESMGPAQYALVASFSFATVLPAVLSLAEWLSTFPRLQRAFQFNVHHSSFDVQHSSFEISNLKFDIRNWPTLVAWLTLGLATLGLALLGVYPDYLFPLLWLGPLALSVAAQSLLGMPTIFRGVRSGDWRGPATFALAALCCGLLWECWNYWSLAKWIYSVPFVQRFHLFEMPLLGYAGYLPFGCECAAAALWIVASGGCCSRIPPNPSGEGLRPVHNGHADSAVSTLTAMSACHVNVATPYCSMEQEREDASP